MDLFKRGSSEFKAVLLDLTMPVMDGFETVGRLREIDPSVPVILSSGYDESEATRRFSQSRLAGFIQKPYTASKLVAILDDIAGNPH